MCGKCIQIPVNMTNNEKLQELQAALAITPMNHTVKRGNLEAEITVLLAADPDAEYIGTTAAPVTPAAPVAPATQTAATNNAARITYTRQGNDADIVPAVNSLVVLASLVPTTVYATVYKRKVAQPGRPDLFVSCPSNMGVRGEVSLTAASRILGRPVKEGDRVPVKVIALQAGQYYANPNVGAVLPGNNGSAPTTIDKYTIVLVNHSRIANADSQEFVSAAQAAQLAEFRAKSEMVGGAQNLVAMEEINLLQERAKAVQAQASRVSKDQD